MENDTYITPPKVLNLPTHDGQPVPFMTHRHADGQPDHRRLDHARRDQCFAADLCPICGEILGAQAVIWLMGMAEIVNRVSSLPAMHTLCAIWGAARGQFTPPGMVVTLERHHVYQLAHAHDRLGGHPFLLLPDCPDAVTWWRDGKPIDDPMVMLDCIDAYELEAIEQALDVDERSGLNFALERTRQVLVPVLLLNEVRVPAKPAADEGAAA